ncbi:MAG: 4Fe-4S dicluster domain-containing protein [Candidatus Bathyarchaeota archaeon]|jgi:2-oxoglutarate ferredoxin oxidoreductase subunit delta
MNPTGQKTQNTKKRKNQQFHWHVIDAFCKECGLCIEICPVNALETSERINTRGVHPPKLKTQVACIGCGLCERMCPDLAINLEKSESRHE